VHYPSVELVLLQVRIIQLHAGFDDSLFTASELSQDYINIANIRIEKWKGVDIQHYNSKKVIKKKSDKPINSKDKRLF